MQQLHSGWVVAIQELGRRRIRVLRPRVVVMVMMVVVLLVANRWCVKCSNSAQHYREQCGRWWWSWVLDSIGEERQIPSEWQIQLVLGLLERGRRRIGGS